MASMRDRGFDVPFVWVDVEPYPTHPWSRAVLAEPSRWCAAWSEAYQDQGYGVGFYSYDNGWRAVVGSWRKPRFSRLVPVGRRCRTGWRSRPARCASAVLLRRSRCCWPSGSRTTRDRDVTCPLLHGRAAAPHPLTALLGTALRRGDSGPAIRSLQRAMLMRPEYVTGRFGLRTERVLLAMQRSRGLPPTGVATDVELTTLGAGTVVPGLPNRLADLFTPY